MNSRFLMLAFLIRTLIFRELQLAPALQSGGSVREGMLRIHRWSNGIVVFSLSGRIEREDIPELRRLFTLEPGDQDIALDLQELTLIDRDAVEFLAHCEAENIRLENCPAYVREWMEAERRGRQRR